MLFFVKQGYSCLTFRTNYGCLNFLVLVLLTGMKQWIIFKTENNNCYLYNINTRNIHCIEEKMYSILNSFGLEEFFSLNSNNLKGKGIDLSEDNLSQYNYWINRYLVSKKSSSTIDFFNKISEEDIKLQLSNNPNVLFEVTENCNLNCLYCTYGGFYGGHALRKNSSLSIESAISVIDTVFKHCNSNLNTSHKNYIDISFYGGEPLLRMDFIRDVVKYTKGIRSSKVDFKFGMTTNAVLLDKHVNFLVSNKFELLISLDGNVEHNIYRRYKNGKESFNKVYKNIKALCKKHPIYFKDYVNINSVLHNKNNFGSIVRFIKNEFGVEPLIQEVSTDGLIHDKKDQLLRLYKNKNESLKQSEDYYRLINLENVSNKPELEESVFFVNNSLSLALAGLPELNPNFRKAIKPSGTCLPFARKIFVTSQGKLLPCENVPHDYAFGEVISGSLKLDLKKMANRYNMLLKKMTPLCSSCYRVTNCSQCMFFLNLNEEVIKCYGFMNKEEYTKYLSRIIGYIENNTKSHKRIIYEKIIS